MSTVVCYFIFFSLKDGRLTVEQRKELVDKGPFNLIFHGLEPDWIEAEMDDDPEFIRDVIGQRIRTMIREEVNLEYLIFS